MTLFFAKLISLVFGPVVWIPLMIYAFLAKAQISWQDRLILAVAYAVFLFIAPLLYVVRSYLKRRISDIDISNRKQRFKYLLLFIFSSLILTGFVYFYGDSFLLKMQILILIILAVNTLITFFWKISFHMTANIVGSLMVNYLFDWQFPYLFLIIPLIFWSRLYLKKHTAAQLLGALILNGGIAVVYLIMF